MEAYDIGLAPSVKRQDPELTAPQGGCISPLLSNIYLDPLDHLMAERGFEMVRYADDCAPRRCEGTTSGVSSNAMLRER